MRNLMLHRPSRLLIPALLLAFGLVSTAAAQEIPLGSKMPAADQNLGTAAGGQASLASLKGTKGTVVVFWSNQCPWIDKYEARVLALAREFRGQGFGFVFVNANDAAAYPKESAAESKGKGYEVAYLLDTSSSLARAFGAERTPHVYVFDASSALVYVGAIDDSPGDPGSVGQSYLRMALGEIGRGAAVSMPKTKAFGCMIKHKN